MLQISEEIKPAWLHIQGVRLNSISPRRQIDRAIAVFNSVSIKARPRHPAASAESGDVVDPLIPQSITAHSQNQSGPNLQEQYLSIGKTLTMAESSFMTVGVPLLLSTDRSRRARNPQVSSIEEFLRLGLTTIPTKTLESYQEDLELLVNSARSTEQLGIEPLTKAERAQLPLLFFLIIAGAVYLSLSMITSPGAFATAVSCLAGLVSLSIGISLSSEPYRRTSFCSTLMKEILRRKGIDPNNNDRFGLLPITPQT